MISKTARFFKKYATTLLFFILTALAHSGNHNTQQSKTELGEAIKLNSKWEQPRLLMADINFRERNSSEAINQLNIILKDNPSNIQARLLLGDAYLSKRDIPGAAREYDAVIKYSPNNPVGYIQSSKVLLYQKKEKEALVRLERALSLQPDNVNALQLIASVCLSKKIRTKLLKEYSNKLKLCRKILFSIACWDHSTRQKKMWLPLKVI